MEACGRLDEAAAEVMQPSVIQDPPVEAKEIKTNQF